ncbi:uncharacterized protein LOC122370346 [Amphibalanus amphitrite]|uniref:uncharacterized protein LOC122370346 n=1 Tax=Amphibalanus amphitrite TaxID=1232801 RepID=UPI001C907707|nr:uncharacterized protein LOC122370346 [Amphibalanus amphitrite]
MAEPYGVDVLQKDNGAEKVWDFPAPGAQHVHIFKDQDKTYALAAFGRGSKTSWLYELVGDSWTARSNLSTFGAVEFTSFVRDNSRYVLAAEYDCGANRADKQGSVLYRLTGGQLQLQHVLPGGHPTDVAIWKNLDTVHIGVASEFESNAYGRANYHVNSSVFKWTDGNFLRHAVPTHGARDLEPFRMHSHSFLAVANHRNNDGSLNLYSEVLRYSLATGQYRSYQRLPTRGAVRFRHFSWGDGVSAEHFLVVANQADRDSAADEVDYGVSSVIYKFSQSQFVPFQCIPTVRARDVLPVWGPSGEFVLAFLDNSGLKLYQYTGWRFVLVTLVPLVPAGDTRLSSFTHDGFSHLTVGSAAGPDSLPSVYRLRFERRHDLLNLHTGCTQWCSGLQAELGRLQPRVDALRARLQEAPRVDQPVTFVSLHVKSTQLVHFSAVSVDNVRLPHNVTLNSGLLARLSTLRGRLQQSLITLDRLRERLNGAVSIAANHTFTQTVILTGSWHLSTVSARRLQLRALNSVTNVSELLAALVPTDRPYSSEAARLAFGSLRLSAGANLTVGTLSHVRPSSIVTLSGDHDITASKVLGGHVTAADVRAQFVNGLRVSGDTVLVQGTLPGAVTRFSSLTVADLRVQYINGIDVKKVMQQAVLSGGGRLTGPVYFAGPVTIHSATVRSINGVSVNRLLRKAFTTTGGQNITASWTVGRLIVTSDLTLAGTLSGLHVPDDFVPVNRPELSYRVGQLSFSEVTVHELTVTERMGPVRVIDGLLQLLLTSGDQLIVSKKTVGSLQLSSNSTVTGTVNGVNITEELLETALEQSASRIDGDKVIRGDVIIVSDLRLSGVLNGLDIPTMLRSALKLRDTALPAMEFNQLEISGDLRATLLNDISPTEWVMTSGVDQIITGSKALLALSAADITVDLLNGLQADGFFGSVLRTEGDQHVRGPLLFAAETVFDTVTANYVNWQGYNLTEEVVTVSGSHVITGTKLFSALLQVADLQVTDLWVDGLVDGVNVSALLTHAADAVNTTYMTVTGSQKFTSRVTASSLVVTGKVNGDDLVATLHDAVRDAMVVGDLTFDAAVTVERLTFTGSMDGVPSTEFGSDWLVSGGGQTLAGPLQFTHDAMVTTPTLAVTLGGRLNGVGGGKLLDGRIPITEEVVITQNVTIHSLATPEVTIQMEGMNFTDVMRQNQSQVVLGVKVFLGGMRALNTFSVEGPINGVHLDEVCRRTVLPGDGGVTFDTVTVHGDVTLHQVTDILSWTVNGVALGELEQRYWLRDAKQTLTGRVALSKPYFTAVEDVQTLLSGESAVAVDLRPYMANYWSLSRPQTVTAPVTFLSDVTLASLSSDKLTVLGLLNGRRLSTLRDSVLTLDGGTATGEWVLPELVVTGPVSFVTLNSIPGSALVPTSATEVHFTAQQTVRYMVVLGDVILPDGGLVYRLDLSRELNSTNFLSGRPGALTPLVVTSDVVFGCEALTFTQPLTVLGTVNGVRLTRSTVLTLSGEQRVPGVTRLIHVGGPCLKLPQLTTRLLNGVDIERLIKYAVRVAGLASQSDTALVVNGRWTFTHVPAMLGYYADDTDAEQRMAELLRQVLWALQQLGSLNQTTADEHLTVLRDIYRALQEARGQLQRASYLQYFVSVQRWSSDIVRLLPVFVDGAAAPPAFLLAVWPDRVQLLRWRTGDNFGRWIDGPRYPERRVAAMAGLRLADGTAYIAEARLAEPARGQQVEDRVYRWDDPALSQLGDAVNYIFLYHRDVLTQSLAMPSHKTVDVKSLKPSPDHDCFLFVHFSGNGSHLVCHSAGQRGFVVHQTLPTYRARQASVYSASGSVCVAVAGGGRVDLWCWDPELLRLTRRQTIAAAAVGVTTAQLGGRTLLAVTRADSGKLTGLVDIYGLEPAWSQFRHLQTVPVWGVRAARLLTLPSEQLLLACLTADGRAVYLEYRGPSGFEPRGELSVGPAASLEVFNMEGLATQLAVAGRPTLDMFALEEHYPAAVFAGKFMGHAW